MGWLHLKLFSRIGLAKIRRVAEPPALEADQKPTIDLDSLRAIYVNRMYVLRHYLQEVTLPALEREALEDEGAQPKRVVRSAAHLLRWQPNMLDEESQEWLRELIERHPGLESVLEYRNELKSFWEGAYRSNDKLLADFRAWCARAEASGIQGMQDFVAYLRSFRAMPEQTAAT
jgi:stearoyl-CoA desaturase (delta-9 desaturase)